MKFAQESKSQRGAKYAPTAVDDSADGSGKGGDAGKVTGGGEATIGNVDRGLVA